MAAYKHYLPAASAAEHELLETLAREHPHQLQVRSRPLRESAQVFFEVDSPAMAGWIWFLLSRLRQAQRRVEAQYRCGGRRPAA
ncbi:MAG: hypothetical protein VKO64_09780 [Candidatus Sericytochromatia bacterium]|nr:hypothetical protein [Candidatus Sericytochromatia bacterium]